MSLQTYEYIENDQTFRFLAFNQSETLILEDFFRGYLKLQDIISLKFPMSQYLRIAKIKQISKLDHQLNIQFYYEGNNGYKYPVIYGQEQFQKALPLTRIYPNKKYLDVNGIKSVFQSLVEIFHWSANFGLFLDPSYDNLLYKKMEGDFYLFIPSFYIQPNKQLSKRSQISDYLMSSEITFIFLLRLLTEFIDVVKYIDEEIKLYKKIKDKYKFFEEIDQIDPYQIQETCLGVDFIYSENQVKKKMIRYGLKQSQFLYQLNSNQILLATLYTYLEEEQNILDQNINEETLTNNTQKFFTYLQNKQIQGISYDIYTQFQKKLIQLKDDNKITTRRNWKQLYTKHELELIKSNIQTDINDPQNLQNISEIFDIKWSSSINPQNLIYVAISQSGVQVDNDIKKFTITYRIEMIDDKNCYQVKTQVPEILYAIDTADEIAFLVNSFQKEQMPTSLFIDDSRKLTISTALLFSHARPILWEILKIMDIHQIYFYSCLEFYIKNINQGKQQREVKYSSFLTELRNLLKDYEQDSNQIYINIKNRQQGEIGF
ncbi:unnamed protein product [Paramecium sonneborni]|uniref:Uncharacterized protein n=1 Tax=Paramecium sonneborni TaxID=65129 RepID=A0A8S1P4X4_9CILI|nr:unnamed protein product [Paramecium sonneborni]